MTISNSCYFHTLVSFEPSFQIGIGRIRRTAIIIRQKWRGYPRGWICIGFLGSANALLDRAYGKPAVKEEQETVDLPPVVIQLANS